MYFDIIITVLITFLFIYFLKKANKNKSNMVNTSVLICIIGGIFSVKLFELYNLIDLNKTIKLSSIIQLIILTFVFSYLIYNKFKKIEK